MATIKEVRNVVMALSDEEFERFKGDTGGTERDDREVYVKRFAFEFMNQELGFCYYLNRITPPESFKLETENEKRTKASVESAQARIVLAETTAQMARSTRSAAWCSAFAAIAMFVLAVVGVITLLMGLHP